MSPNGVKAWEKDGTAYGLIDKTEYHYNHRGLLLTVVEPDAGTTRYIYRNDGSIRFSQNAEQKIGNRFSYTHYDAQGRPAESGEYTGGTVTFVLMDSAVFTTSPIHEQLEKVDYEQT